MQGFDFGVFTLSVVKKSQIVQVARNVQMIGTEGLFETCYCIPIERLSESVISLILVN